MTGEFQDTAECLEDIAGSSWKSVVAYQFRWLGGARERSWELKWQDFL